MNELQQVFTYEGKRVRTVTIDGEPWFVAKDVCDILTLGDTHKVVERLEDDERNSIPVTDSMGRQQDTWVVNESGLYSLILGSRKPEAKQFKRWVTHEVLPAIRKTGMYAVQPQYKIPQTYAEALRLAADLAEENEKQRLALEAAKPKVEFYDAVAGSKDAISIRDAAKVLGIKGIGQNKLFAILREKKVLMSDNRPYQEYCDRGYFRVIEQKFTVGDETRIYIKTLVYQKGLDFIRRLLTKSNVVELPEKGA